MVWKKTLDAIKGRLGWKDDADWTLTDRTQFSEPPPKGRPLQLIIGLDFGTAFTKVVIGEQRVRYAVPFAPYAPKSNPYLLPSALSVFGEQEECLLGMQKGAGRQIDELKMRLIKRDFSPETRTLCAAFIAQVLRCARGWLLHTQERTYKDRRIVWLVNIGLPTDSYHDRTLVDTYREITEIAWTVSVLPGPVSLKRIALYVERGGVDAAILPKPFRHRLLDPEYIQTFPEFAVQLVGYVRSPRRRESLHALVDVGAGTLDFTTFTVFRNRDGEDLFPIHARGVAPLGTRFLIENRLNGTRTTTNWHLSPFEDVPSDEQFRKRLRLSEQGLADLDLPFRKKVADLLQSRLKYTKERRCPLSSHWETGVPTFVCGGGARVPAYGNLFLRFSQMAPPSKLAINSLAAPDDLKAPKLPRNTYDRLSVAYGLSYIPDDIGQVFREMETADFTEEQARQQNQTGDNRDRYVDKDWV